MLRQFEEEETQPNKYINNYKPTDIFNLAPLPGAGGQQKRVIVDRNRSSLFNDGSVKNNSTSNNSYGSGQLRNVSSGGSARNSSNNIRTTNNVSQESEHPPLQQSTPRKIDHMASDIFFGGNSPANNRFAGASTYVPSSHGNSRRSSAAREHLQDYHQQPHPRTTLVNAAAAAAAMSSAPVSVAPVAPAHEEEEYHRQASASYEPESIKSYEQHQVEDNTPSAYSASNSISNVFEAASQDSNLRGARRHYAQRQQSSDIFFQGAPSGGSEPQSRRQSLQKNVSSYGSDSGVAQPWVPSVKINSNSQSSSFSNIFGNASNEKSFGVSSESQSRERKGRGGVRGPSNSQIWF